MPEETVTVYYDFLCPFAWRGAEVAAWVAEPLGLRFEWRHFSLYQSNYHGDDGWQLWNQAIDPDDEHGTMGLLPFLASCAARRQGEALHDRFRLTLMRARYCEGRTYGYDTMLEVAERVGLHPARFASDLEDPECRTVLAREHHRAAGLHVFGTPTFCFEGGDAAYFRLRDLPRDAAEALELFRTFRDVLERYPYLQTVKRPRPRGN